MFDDGDAIKFVRSSSTFNTVFDGRLRFATARAGGNSENSRMTSVAAPDAKASSWPSSAHSKPAHSRILYSAKEIPWSASAPPAASKQVRGQSRLPSLAPALDRSGFKQIDTLRTDYVTAVI